MYTAVTSYYQETAYIYRAGTVVISLELYDLNITGVSVTFSARGKLVSTARQNIWTEILYNKNFPGGGGYSGFQVMGMIEGFFGVTLKFRIPGFFWVQKFGKYFFG